MRLFFKYIYQYRNIALILLIFLGIFAGIFTLYDIGTEIILYAFLLCTTIGSAIISINFIRFRKRDELRSISSYCLFYYLIKRKFSYNKIS